MNCTECKVKMKCRYSIALGERSRLRFYKCLKCKTYLHTVEFPREYTENAEAHKRLNEMVAQATQEHFAFVKAIKKARALGTGKG